MNKKGAELSFNVIIIAILVILVLVVIAAFFLGGFGNLIDILTGQSIDNVEAATSTCSSSCALAQTYDSKIQKENSGYCRKTFKFDYNPEDGQVDRDPVDNSLKNYHCYEAPISVTCADVQDSCES